MRDVRLLLKKLAISPGSSRSIEICLLSYKFTVRKWFFLYALCKDTGEVKLRVI